jgi:hypothetical protein
MWNNALCYEKIATSPMLVIRECKTHTSTCEAKEKEEHEICLEFCGTTPVIFKPTISDPNEVGLTPNLETLFLA